MKTFWKWVMWILIGAFVLGFMACITLVTMSVSSVSTKD